MSHNYAILLAIPACRLRWNRAGGREDQWHGSCISGGTTLRGKSKSTLLLK